jgi:hypothetical protein
MTRAVATKLDERAWLVRFERGEVLSWAQVMAGLVTDAGLRDALTGAILAAPFAAVYWEARPVADGDREEVFECVVLDAPGLARERADGRPFAQPLAGSRAPAVRAFANLSGDAELVVPAPGDDVEGYPHLAAFLRRAPAEQVHALWTEVGHAVTRWLTTRGTRVWVSTAGLGVAWLHVRLDSRPKYVKWAAYRAMR